jgi:hypothetical protein
MTATPEALRVGETFDLEAFPVDESGKETFTVNETWNPTSGDFDAIDYETDEGNQKIMHGEAIEPGSVTMRFTAVDLFFDPVGPVDTPLRVLDADRLIIRVGAPSANVQVTTSNGTLTVRVTGDTPTPSIAVSAHPVDARYGQRNDNNMPDYAPTLTSIAWSTQHQRVVFDTGGGGHPTATGTLSLSLNVNDFGEDVVTVTAVNSLGQTITGVLPIKILGSVSVSVGFTQTDGQ